MIINQMLNYVLDHCSYDLSQKYPNCLFFDVCNRSKSIIMYTVDDNLKHSIHYNCNLEDIVYKIPIIFKNLRGKI